MENLTLSNLEKWLKEKKPTDIVGKTRLDHCDPTANFLIEVNGASKPKVRYEYVSFVSDGKNYETSPSTEYANFLKFMDEDQSLDPIDLTAQDVLVLIQKFKGSLTNVRASD